ncbi:MAG: iron-sulfur cluster assembly scaffold protein [Gammaproteobacteria bacterium]|nr:iron-sulfur cluster assembly scaffold protein [Gammaproteobacteria bacterium]
MSSEPYSATVRALFDNPAHAGELPGQDPVSIDDQGLRVQLFAEFEGDRIRTLRFRAWGCPHVIAAAEAFCAGFEDRSLADLDSFTAAELMQSLAVPVEKTGRILVIEDAVRSLGTKLRGTLTTKQD